jgi:predicted dinucleotide-binding enzyme
MKIAFLGYGNVGAALADKLALAGHDVGLSTSKEASASLTKALARNPALRAVETKEAIRAAEVVFLATPFQTNQALLEGLVDELKGKILVDCTNPVGPGLSHGLKSAQSGSELIASLVPLAKVVKAFTIYGFENLENNQFPGAKAAMFFCGNDAAAKSVVSGLISELGWEPLDVGGLEQALHLEHMTLLWVRMVRMHKASPHMVWAVLKR